MTRAKLEPRTIILRGPEQVERAMALIKNAPIYENRPLEVILREPVKARKPDQNALMFAGPIRDIAAQAWLDGKQYSDETWHYYFKRAFLPEAFDPELCLEGYVKWESDPTGDPVLVGSTKKLTVRGFSQHLEQIYAFGASLGVEFSANVRESQS